MPDSDLVRDILEQLLKATYTIQRRFAPIQAPADFWRLMKGSIVLMLSVCS